MSLQKIVLDLRKTGLTDVEIADAIGSGTSTVNMWANGNRGVKTGDYMLKLFALHMERCKSPSAKRKAA